jgi:hypothetical protein
LVVQPTRYRWKFGRQAKCFGYPLDIGFAKSRSGRSMSEKLAAELLDAYNKRGAAVKKRDDTHRWQRPTRRLRIIAGRKE